MEQLPPHSIDAEMAILGCVMLDPITMDQCLEAFAGHSVFYENRSREIFAAFEALHRAGKPIDLLTVSEQLKSVGKLEDVGGIAHLSTLTEATPGIASLGYYIEIVVEKASLREIIKTCQSVVGRAMAPDANGTEVITSASSEIIRLGDGQVKHQTRTIQDSLVKIMDRLDNMRRGVKQMLGPSCGFNFLDNILCGLQPEQYIVQAGRPGGGKTMLAMQMVEHWVLNHKIPVGVFSLEMSQDALIERMAFSLARAQYQKYRNGFLVMNDVPKLGKAFTQLSEAGRKGLLHIDDETGLSIEQLSLRMRRMHRQHGCQLFVIDYIQLLRGHSKKRYSSDNRNAELTDVSMELLRLKKELKVPIIVLCQMNRNIEAHDQRNRKPVLADLKDCGQIEQDADVVMFIYDVNMKKQIEDPNPDPDDEQLKWLKSDTIISEVPPEWRCLVENGKVEAWHSHMKRQNVLVAKQRNGPSDKSAAMVRVNEWCRYIDAYRAVKVKPEDAL